ncbi:MAG TPA: hypothetical protein VGM20_00635 [Gemmatimonadales bacterium]|jgi:hypothetical protein
MTRSATAFTVAALFALTACGRKGARSSDFDSATTAALGGTASAGSAAAANAPKVGHVMGIEIGRSLDSANRIILGGAAGFGSSDSVLASVRTIYANAGTPVSVRIRLKDQTVDSAASKTAAADTAGVAIVPFRFAPLKKDGAYQAEVFLDGKFQMAAAFKVGS